MTNKVGGVLGLRWIFQVSYHFSKFFYSNISFSVLVSFNFSNQSRDFGFTRSASARLRLDDGIESRHNTTSKTYSYCFYIRCTSLIVRVRGKVLTQCTVRTSRQRSCNQRNGCLLSVTLLIVTWAIERFTLQFTRRECSVLRGLSPSPQEV